MEPGKSAMEVGESLGEYDEYCGLTDGKTQRERIAEYHADDGMEDGQ